MVGLVDENTEQRVQALWAEMDELFGVGDLRRRVPWPHVSFAVASRITDRDGLADATAALAARLDPVEISAPCWAVFTGAGPMFPAVVRSVVRTPALDAAQGIVASGVAAFLADASPFYASESWNPHITVAARDLPADKVGAVVQWLVDGDAPAWQVGITRLGLVVDHDGRHELAVARPLSG